MPCSRQIDSLLFIFFIFGNLQKPPQSGKYQEMEIEGLPKGTDRVFHGLGIFDRSATELTIFVVNHRRTGSVVEVLEYTIGDKTVQYKETIQHELIHTPNDILATGPRSFYVSNDHKYKSGVKREFEGTARTSEPKKSRNQNVDERALGGCFGRLVCSCST